MAHEPTQDRDATQEDVDDEAEAEPVFAPSAPELDEARGFRGPCDQRDLLVLRQELDPDRGLWEPDRCPRRKSYAGSPSPVST